MQDLGTFVEQLARFLGVSCDKAQLEGLAESCNQLIEQCSNSEALSVCRGEYKRNLRNWPQTAKPAAYVPATRFNNMAVSLATTATLYVISLQVFTPFLS